MVERDNISFLMIVATLVKDTARNLRDSEILRRTTRLAGVFFEF